MPGPGMTRLLRRRKKAAIREHLRQARSAPPEVRFFALLAARVFDIDLKQGR